MSYSKLSNVHLGKINLKDHIPWIMNWANLNVPNQRKLQQLIWSQILPDKQFQGTIGIKELNTLELSVNQVKFNLHADKYRAVHTAFQAKAKKWS